MRVNGSRADDSTPWWSLPVCLVLAPATGETDQIVVSAVSGYAISVRGSESEPLDLLCLTSEGEQNGGSQDDSAGDQC